VPPTGFPHSNPGLGQVLDLHVAAKSPEIAFDNVSASKYFDYIEQAKGSPHFGHRRRVTYDDAETIGLKYAAVLEAGVGGIGIWTADATHRDGAADTKSLAAEMWRAVGHATRAPYQHE
jgi:spore germination protein YaaH